MGILQNINEGLLGARNDDVLIDSSRRVTSQFATLIDKLFLACAKGVPIKKAWSTGPCFLFVSRYKCLERKTSAISFYELFYFVLMLLRATRVRNVCSANRNRYVERQISIQLTRRLRRTNSIAINSKFYSQETRSNDRSIAEDDDFINKFRNARGPSRAAEQVSSKTSSPFRRRRLVEASEKLAHQVEGDPSLIESNSDNHEIASNNVLHGSWDTTKPASEEEWRSSYLDLESAREPSPFEGSPASLEPSQELTRNRGTKFKHSLLRPAHIKIDALGKPVEALVMANPDQLARRKEKGSVVKEMEEQGSSGIETTMEYLLSFEDGADMELMDQAFRNIGEMQPTETKVLPKADFEKLVAQLVQGFTQAQILYYISHHKKPSKETETVAFDWADRIGIWEPESPMDWGVLKPKQKQALRIVQEVWGLEVLEHIEATGKMPIWLQQSALQLLARKCHASLSHKVSRLADKLIRNRTIERSTRDDQTRVSRRIEKRKYFHLSGPVCAAH